MSGTRPTTEAGWVDDVPVDTGKAVLLGRFPVLGLYAPDDDLRLRAGVVVVFDPEGVDVWEIEYGVLVPLDGIIVGDLSCDELTEVPFWRAADERVANVEAGIDGVSVEEVGRGVRLLDEALAEAS